MAEIHRIYLDQMFRLDVAEVLRNQGYDVVRASETGHARADDRQILERSISPFSAVMKKKFYNISQA